MTDIRTPESRWSIAWRWLASGAMFCFAMLAILITNRHEFLLLLPFWLMWGACATMQGRVPKWVLVVWALGMVAAAAVMVSEEMMR